MEEIVRKLMENRMDEMALERSKAIDVCISRGNQFIKHFHKLYAGGIDDRDFNHHCHEMQVWYDDVKDIIMKPKNKQISRTQLIDWFFTAGSTIEVKFRNNEDEGDMYEELVLKLLSSTDTIKTIMTELLSNQKGI